MAAHDAARAQLEKALSRLLNRVGKIGSDLRQTPDPDWSEKAVEQENDEVLEKLDAISRREVVQLRAALERIATGTYGVCSKCGGRIEADRLAAMPTAITCIGCANTVSGS